MNYLLAKVKRRTNHFKVLSEISGIYDDPNLTDTIVYNPATLLDDGQWYRIEDFSESEFSIDLINDVFSSVNYAQIDKSQISKISYLCAVQGQKYYFQHISANQLIKKNWFSADELTIEKDSPIVTLNKLPDIVYDKILDFLYFKKLSVVNTIFDGMDQLYRTATDAETQTFLDNDFLRMTNNFGVNSVKIPNRKRIAIVMDTLNAYSHQERADILVYIQGYSNVPFVNNAFEVETEDHLKHILYGIEQRFYTTQLGNEKRLANSIVSLP
jgi:hypothetical protein